jgi:TRAP transporter TAXI family solute receptor
MREALKLSVPLVLIVGLGFWLAFRFVGPAPPRELRLATGPDGGLYQGFGQRYSQVLDRDGVTLTLVPTAGSVENIELLEARKVDIALVQGGTSHTAQSDSLVSLGSLFLEPIWIFGRVGGKRGDVRDLLGGRIAVGPVGSGTRAGALEILGSMGVTEENTTMLPLEGAAAGRALSEGRIDLALVVASAQAPVVHEIALMPGVDIRSMPNAEAYVRHHRYLSRLVLPGLILDLAEGVPPEPVTVIATAANLVARNDFHPALVDLLIGAIQQVHGDGGLIELSDQFPSTEYLEFPLDEEAARYYAHGPTFLRRVLPFWAATLIARFFVLILPIVALLVPLVRAFPPVYQWRVRSRIYRWYSEVKRMDPGLQDELSHADVAQYLEELARVESEVTRVETPLSYADQVYNLRIHINYVRERLTERLRALEATA